MCPRSILFDLLPKAEIFFKLFPSIVFFIHNKRVLRKFLLREEHFYKLEISCLMLFYSRIPLRLIFREISKDYFPAVLSKDCSFIRDSLCEKGLEFSNIDDRLIKHINQTSYFFCYYGWQAFGIKMFSTRKSRSLHYYYNIEKSKSTDSQIDIIRIRKVNRYR